MELRFGQTPERLALRPDGSAANGTTLLRPAEDGLRMERRGENLSTRLLPCTGSATMDVAGRYRCDELGAELEIVDAGGVLYGAFSGALGQGRMELLDPVGADLGTLPCPRALDHTPPGDWTLAFERADGRVAGVTVGCWLARRLSYRRIG